MTAEALRAGGRLVTTEKGNDVSAVIQKANQDLDVLMQRIAERLGGKYRLTLICRYDGGDLEDADILKSDDDFEKAIAAMRRLMNRAPV